MYRFKLLSFSLLVFAVAACSNNESGEGIVTEDQLYGRWDLQEATRNGQPTETLNTTFFEFYEDGKMISNLSGSRENVQYEFKSEDRMIRQLDGRMPTDFSITTLTDSTLHLEMSLRSIPFQLQLVRGGEATPED